MTLGGAIVVWLLDTVNNANNIASLVGERIDPDILSEETDYPAVTYTRSSMSPSTSHDGAITHYEVNYQIETYGITLAEAQEVADRITASFHGLTNTEIAPGFMLGSAFFENQQDEHEPELKRWRIIQEYLFIYEL